jgi:hypothetical protein
MRPAPRLARAAGVLQCRGRDVRFRRGPSAAHPELRAQLERGANRPLPVVRYDDRASERSLDVMRWGLP